MSPRIKTVVLMRGIPGVGKSYVVNQQFSKAFVCSTDRFFINPRTQAYEFDASKLGEAHGNCLKAFLHAITDNEPLVVVDNVNAKALDMAPYVALGEAFGYHVRIITLLPTMSLPDIAKRNVHGVPLEKIQRYDVELTVESKLLPRWWHHEFMGHAS